MKGLIILRRGEYIHVILLTKLCWIAIVQDLVFLQVDTPFNFKLKLIIAINLRAVF